MTTKNGTKELEINEMNTTSSLPAKPDDLKGIEPIMAEVRNQQTGEFEKVMISPRDIQNYICPTATLQELYIFMSICRHQGIDPISEASFVKFGDKPGFTVMKYTVYLKRAMQSGVLKSIRHEFDDEDNPTKIMVYIQRNDMEGEWVWTTYRSEVEKRRNRDNKVTEIWDTQLRFMMTKCGYSQGLRFFCADVVGALPPTQEEMPGIGALNMQSALTGDTEEQAEVLESKESKFEEVLEVADVKPLPEHLDMAPLRNTFHGMINGMFTSDDDRHTWQMQHTGTASMKEWGPEQYAKAFKALSQEAGPPNGTQEEEAQEEAEETSKTRDGKPVEDAVKDAVKDGVEENEYLATVRRRYVAHVNGRFETPEQQEKWQKANMGEGDIDKWFPADFIRALALLDEADLKKKAQAAAKETGEITEDFIPEAPGYIRADEAREFENVKRDYEKRIKGRFQDEKDLLIWQESVSQTSGGTDTWETAHYQMAHKELDKLDRIENQEPIVLNEFLSLGADLELYPDDKGTVVKAKVFAIGTKAIEIEIEQGSETKKAAFLNADVQTWLKDGKWKVIPADDASANSTTTQDATEDDEEALMTAEQFKELKDLVGQLPKYNKNLGSKQFRDRAAEITGRRPRGIRTYTQDESAELILQFADEIEDLKASLVKDEEHRQRDMNFLNKNQDE